MLHSTMEAAAITGTPAARAVAGNEALRAALDERAGAARHRRLELFGDAPVRVGAPPPWSVDVHSGHAWAPAPARSIDCLDLGRRSDVKVPWEMSRLRHCVALAQAAAVNGDRGILRVLDTDLGDWVRANPVGMTVNWASAMEVALRAVNLLSIEAIVPAPPSRLRGLLRRTLHEHGDFLARNLELAEPRNNHYLANAVGLLWLGRRFGAASAARRWSRDGATMALTAAREQVLSDGVGFEGSLRYHVLALELFCLARLAAPRTLQALEPTISAMLDALCAISGPDGRVPDLGDDDGGRATALCDAPAADGRRVANLAAALIGHPGGAALGAGGPVEDALWLLGPERARSLASLAAGAPKPVRPAHLAAAGVAVLGDRDDHVVIDVGPVGTHGRGGHGHLDAMSFEAHLGGELAVRDSGTGSYTRDPDLRDALRGLAAHSVVIVDGRSYARLGGITGIWSIEGDSPPQVLELRGERARQVLVATQALPAATGAAEHRRTLEWSPGSLRVGDRVDTPPGARVVHLLQVPDGVELTAGGAGGGRLAYRVRGPHGSQLRLERRPRSEHYGSVGLGGCLTLSYTAGSESSEVVWEIARTGSQ